VWAEGSAGGLELARAVVEAAESGEATPRFLYELDLPAEDKIARIATQIYGADGVDYAPRARRQLARAREQGLDRLPICMAKTPLSLSDDASKKGRPSGFRITIREVRVYAGAGYLAPVAGEIMTMPGLPSRAAYQQIDIDADGRIVGLF
jgi:formate--tetrahydrofolate ligase